MWLEAAEAPEAKSFRSTRRTSTPWSAADDDDLGARVLPDRTQRRVALPDGGR
jgi:hypothetical protein